MSANPQTADSDSAEAWFARGRALLEAKRNQEALNAFDEAQLRRPDWAELEFPHYDAAWRALYDSVNTSDWRWYDYLQRLVVSRIRRGHTFVGETALASPYMDGAVQLTGARNFCTAYANTPRPFSHRRPGPKIRLGFVGADFHQQATAYLLTGVIEQFDRSRFELRGYDFGPNAAGKLRERSLQAYDAVIPIHDLSDQQAAERIHADGIDVLFHMRGLANGKIGVFAYRPAAIQIHYLYFPGSSGADCIDYIIADDFVIPPGLESNYAERVLRLPGCYQPNDSRRALPSARRRADFGIPDEAVVLANFSQNYKISPDVFALWCRLLLADPRRVLWLLANDPVVQANLRREAVNHGVHPRRLLFGPALNTDDHLARLRASDLVLDTYPYGGHTLTSDALWAGVPVVTMVGTTFASRVAGSLLRAVGLERLAANSPDQYLAVADALARQPEERQRVRAALDAGRSSFELFSSAAYARKFERLLLDLVANRWP